MNPAGPQVDVRHPPTGASQVGDPTYERGASGMRRGVEPGIGPEGEYPPVLDAARVLELLCSEPIAVTHGGMLPRFAASRSPGRVGYTGEDADDDGEHHQPSTDQDEPNRMSLGGMFDRTWSQFPPDEGHAFRWVDLLANDALNDENKPDHEQDEHAAHHHEVHRDPPGPPNDSAGRENRTPSRSTVKVGCHDCRADRSRTFAERRWAHFDE